MTVALRRTGWLVASLLLFGYLHSFFRQPVALPLILGVVAFIALSAWRPFIGLLLLAGIGPMSGAIMAMGRGDAGTIVLVEVATTAFLAVWAARRAHQPDPLLVPTVVQGTATLLAIAAAVSAAVRSAQAAVELQTEPAGEIVRLHLTDVILHPSGAEAVWAAMLVVTGALLVIAAAHLTAQAPGRRTAVLRMMVLGAAGAAAVNLLRLTTSAVRTGDFGRAFVEMLATIRVNVQFPDLNAAGSYFALALLLAAGLAVRSRGLFIASFPLLLAGLWLSGSRVALGAALCAGVGALLAWAYSVGSGRLRRGLLGALLVVGVAGAAVWNWYPAGRNIQVVKAMEIRAALARVAIDMIADHPVFGVGPGRFYPLSGRYTGETLAGLGFERENAHNNFLQVGAELGIPGLLTFLVLLFATGRELARGPRSAEALWLGAGITAYLLSCLGGHPLLIPDAAYPFWLALGLAAACGDRPLTPPSRWRFAWMALAIALVISVVPRTIAARRTADLEHVSEGFSKWQRDGDVDRFRWAGGRSSFYVPSSARAIRLLLWHADQDRRTIEVRILQNGREADRVMLPAEDRWREVRILVNPSVEAAFVKFELVAYRAGESEPLATVATDQGGAIRVGRPVIEPGR